ncbi:MAG: hypothetical protein ABI689_14470, partial [Thermoanaerobaculia bacterium]
MRRSRAGRLAAHVGVVAVVGALGLSAANGQETPPATAAAGDESAAMAAGGSAEGWLEVARERTVLRYAYVLGESGDGASGELLVVLADRELPETALASAALRDDLAAADEVRSLVARIPESIGGPTGQAGPGEIEVWFHHPRLPHGISLRGLAHFVRETETAARLEGRLVLGGEGTNLEAWFSAPILRGNFATWPEIAAEARTLPPDRTFEEV